MSEVYVGARYVPKFFANPNGTCEWLGNVPYEPLTIVTYLGNSYTSKVPVPPGIGNPSLNPTYWALTGNYNAQIDNYRQETKRVSDALTAVQTDVAALKPLALLKNNIPTYALYIGNSYTNGVGSSSGSDGTAKLTSFLWDGWTMDTGSGTGFADRDDREGNFYTQLKSKVDGTSMDNDKVTHVFFLSAVGDSVALTRNPSSAIDSIKENAAKCYNLAKASFPNLQMIKCFLLDMRSQLKIPYVDWNYTSSFVTHSVLATVLPNVGISYGGWLSWSTFMQAPYTDVDKYHPSDAGYRAIANQFVGLLYGSPSYGTFAQQNSILTEADTNVVLQMGLTPDQWTLHGYSNIPVSVNANSSYEVSLANNYFLPFYQFASSVPDSVRICQFLFKGGAKFLSANLDYDIKNSKWIITTGSGENLTGANIIGLDYTYSRAFTGIMS